MLDANVPAETARPGAGQRPGASISCSLLPALPADRDPRLLRCAHTAQVASQSSGHRHLLHRPRLQQCVLATASQAAAQHSMGARAGVITPENKPLAVVSIGCHQSSGQGLDAMHCEANAGSFVTGAPCAEAPMLARRASLPPSRALQAHHSSPEPWHLQAAPAAPVKRPCTVRGPQRSTGRLRCSGTTLGAGSTA